MQEFDYNAFGVYIPSGNRNRPEIMSLSGGRSSAHALLSLVNGGFGKSTDIIAFQNTGKEHETCLQFLHELQAYLPLPITWIEYTNTEVFNTLIRSDFSYDAFNEGQYNHIFQIVDTAKIFKFKYSKSKNNFWYKEGYSDSTKSFKIVDYSTASRNGKPFTDIFLYKCLVRVLSRKDLILPNAAQRWCTADMKIKVLDRYLKSAEISHYRHYFGMRFDEPGRVDKLFRLNDTNLKVENDCPLFWNNITKSDVLQAWANQPIDLGLSKQVNSYRDFLGNCVYCHLKAKLKKLYLIQQGHDIRFYAQLERIVNSFNHIKSAMSNQAGTMDSIYDEAMNMPPISIMDVLNDSEKEIHCFSCGD